MEIPWETLPNSEKHTLMTTVWECGPTTPMLICLELEKKVTHVFANGDILCG